MGFHQFWQLYPIDRPAFKLHSNLSPISLIFEMTEVTGAGLNSLKKEALQAECILLAG